MQQGRGGAFGVASEEKIFVAGGLNEKNKVSKNARCTMLLQTNGTSLEA